MFKSLLYKCRVGHYRKEPIKRSFNYSIFMWYINIDEIQELTRKIPFVSRNKFNYYSFYDNDHLKQEGVSSKWLGDHIRAYVKANDETTEVSKIMLLTNLATLGYQFNPVSFYFCFDKHNQPLCSIAEVGNTYREMKPYFIGRRYYREGAFRYSTKKLFYVSPFIDHDVDFDFILPIPAENLHIRIDDYKDKKRFFTATLIGKEAPMSIKNVALSILQFPLVTLKVIGLIHYQACLLWLKKVHHHKKKDFPDLQVGVYNKYNSKK